MTASIMLDVDGLALSNEDKELIAHPGCCGVILFKRNCESPEQIIELTKQIRAAANRPLVITIDQEGGRVQRIKAPLTRLPALQQISQSSEDIAVTKQTAYNAARLMALEVNSLGIDLSFAPVLDLDDEHSKIIGDRSFAKDPNKTIQLASAYIDGMHSVGMPATGKHFPGHGSVVADSHEELPVDERSKAAIWAHDLKPFAALKDQLDAIMPAHMLYPALDDKPAGMSSFWLQSVLRQEIGFHGVIFSDDLDMAGAAAGGSYCERAALSLEAGCDIALICNNRSAAEEILDNFQHYRVKDASYQRLVNNRRQWWGELTEDPSYKSLRTEIESLVHHEK